jgi:hypothetical protein
MAYKSQPTVTRPANTTAYTAGDVVGGVISFPEIPKGVTVIVAWASLMRYVSSIASGETSYSLKLYDGSPPSAYADNVAWDIPSGDRSYFVTELSIGSPADKGSSLFCDADFNKTINVGRGLYGYLVTNGAYTPGSEDVFHVGLLAEKWSE